jgi:hypothetical protein
MIEQILDEADKPAGETPAITAAEKEFENEGGAPWGGSSAARPAKARTARTSDPLMDRIERSAGRVKARLTAKGRW